MYANRLPGTFGPELNELLQADLVKGVGLPRVLLTT